MSNLKNEINFYKNEINFHLSEVEFWKKELEKVQNLQKKYRKLKMKRGDIFLKSISKMKNISGRDIVAFIIKA